MCSHRCSFVLLCVGYKLLPAAKLPFCHTFSVLQLLLVNEKIASVVVAPLRLTVIFDIIVVVIVRCSNYGYLPLL